jgi:hypothetical protein
VTPTRRSVLAGLIGTGAVVSASGLALVLQPSLLVKPQGALLVLDAQQYSILAAIAGRICPGGEGFPSASEIDVAGRVDALLDRLPAGTAAEITGLLGAFESPIVGLLLDGRARTFSTCAPDEQDGVLAQWRDSRLPQRRTAFLALQHLCSGAYWTHPAVLRAMGYTGPSPGRAVPT